jgi:ATP-dependent DNA helicase RecG
MEGRAVSETLPEGPPVDDELAEQIVANEESRTLEFKRVGNVAKQLETIVAFANTEGGFLVLGVEDEKKARGRDRLYGVQENPESVDELHRKLRSRTTPILAAPEGPDVQFITVGCTLRDGSRGSIVIVVVPKSTTVHSVVDGGTFVRLEKGNRQISASEITELSLRRGATSYVSKLVDVPIDLLETDFWRQYAAMRRLTRPTVDAMRALGFLKFDAAQKLLPTRAAVLLFAESPSDLLDTKCSVRIFQYLGTRVELQPSTNLARPPRSIGGPIIAQISLAQQATLEALASGVQLGPLGFEIAQRYPVRVIREAITNAVIHRDYSTAGDIHVRLFDDRIEVVSPGGLPGGVTLQSIAEGGSHPRNRALVDHLREFPSPPNLDAGEGVRMMFATMRQAELYPPQYSVEQGPEGREEKLKVVLLNQSRPSIWEQVEAHLQRHPSIGNAEVRALLGTDDPVRASRMLKGWLAQGVLVMEDPDAPKQQRRYKLPGAPGKPDLFSLLREKGVR